MPARPAMIHTIVGREALDYVPQYPSTQFILPDCFIGVEMELEGDVDGEAREFRHPLVTCKDDGSLRNGGIEMVFSKPLFGQAAIEAIDTMFSVREQHGLVGSFRTSTHVHVNYTSSNDDAGVLTRSVLVYLLIEKAMALTAGEHREYNTFCVPSYMMVPDAENAMHNVAMLDERDSAYDVNEAIRSLNSMSRYASMNLAALFKYGSVEYRLLGTASKQDTLGWINILLSIKKAAIENTRAALLSQPTLLAFLRTFMPEHGDLLRYDATAEAEYQRVKGMLSQERQPVSEAECVEDAPFMEATTRSSFDHAAMTRYLMQSMPQGTNQPQEPNW